MVDIMDTYALLMTSRPLPPLVALGGSRQGWGFLLSSVLTPPPDGRPGFGQKAARGQGVMAEQRSHQREPATAKDAHQPPLCRPARAPDPSGSTTGLYTRLPNRPTRYSPGAEACPQRRCRGPASGCRSAAQTCAADGNSVSRQAEKFRRY